VRALANDANDASRQLKKKTLHVFNFIKASSAVANAYEHHASYALFLPISNYLYTRES